MGNRHRISRSPKSPMLAAGLFLLLTAGLAEAQSDTRESPPRQLPSTSRAPNPVPPSPAPPPPAPSNPGTTAPSPSPGSGGGGGGGGGRRHSYGYHPDRHHRYHFGFYGFGYHWPYSRFYWDYRYPYYPWGMVWYPAYSSDTRLGALDLNVKPRKVEVYVDGQYVGLAGKLDGYPSYLWLTEGSHQLVFHREGWETVVRRVSVRPGPVRSLRLTLREGETTAPEELFEAPRTARARSDEPAAAPRTPEARATRERSDRAEMDLRGEPGRFRLEIEPRDASVYLDGRFLGSAEELARLHAGMMVDAGEHVIEVQRPGYETETVRFVVEAGDETEVKVDLAASETPSS